MTLRRLSVALLMLVVTVALSAQQPSTSFATRFRFDGTRCTASSGSGSPEGVVVGSPCDIYVRSDASGTNPALYVKLTGTATNTGWYAVVSTAVPSGAPTDATYLTQTANGTLTNEQAMASLATGLVKNATTTGVQSIATAGTDYSAGTSALGTGILKSTTGTGALSIAAAADVPQWWSRAGSVLSPETTGDTLSLSGGTTSGVTDVLINPATKASGNLLDLQVGAASKFRVDYAGQLITNNQIRAGTYFLSASTNGFFVYDRSGFTSGGLGGFNLLGCTTCSTMSRVNFGSSAVTNAALGAAPGSMPALGNVPPAWVDLHAQLADASSPTRFWASGLHAYEPSSLGSESLTNGALTAGTSWSRTGDFALASDKATYTHSAGSGTLVQANGTLAVVVAPSRIYQLTYTISAKSGTPPTCVVTTGIAGTAVPLVTGTNGTGYKAYFSTNTTAASADVTISCTSAATGAFTIDDLSLKQVTAGDTYAGGTAYPGAVSASSTVRAGIATTYDGLILSPVAKGANQYDGTFTSADLTAARTWTFPDASLSLAAPTDGYLVASSSTGYKTVRDFLVIYQGAARCQGASAITFWNLPSGGTAPSANCIAGTNIIRASLDFNDLANHVAQIPFYLPDDIDLTGDVEFEVYWSTPATTGDVKWQVSTACVGVDEDIDPAYNAAQTITQAALANANRKNVGEIAALTTTGCAGGEVLFVKIERDGGATGDTIADTARLIATELKYYRKW